MPSSRLWVLRRTTGLLVGGRTNYWDVVLTLRAPSLCPWLGTRTRSLALTLRVPSRLSPSRRCPGPRRRSRTAWCNWPGPGSCCAGRRRNRTSPTAALAPAPPARRRAGGAGASAAVGDVRLRRRPAQQDPGPGQLHHAVRLLRRGPWQRREGDHREGTRRVSASERVRVPSHGHSEGTRRVSASERVRVPSHGHSEGTRRVRTTSQ